jgi:hypothetical protein
LAGGIEFRGAATRGGIGAGRGRTEDEDEDEEEVKRVSTHASIAVCASQS